MIINQITLNQYAKIPDLVVVVGKRRITWKLHLHTFIHGGNFACIQILPKEDASMR
jgi:hypothetical protein